MELVTHGKYEAIPSILVRKHYEERSYQDWLHREMKEGGLVHRYLDFKRRQTDARYRAVAQKHNGFRQNTKVDARVVAHIPLHDFLRWNQTDPHFFDDDSNLRSLRRDNPDVRVYI